MHVNIGIPDSAEAQLRNALGSDLGEAATEALLINGYRTARLSLGFLAEALGLATRLEAQAWLAARNVPLNYDVDELEADRAAVRERFHVEL